MPRHRDHFEQKKKLDLGTIFQLLHIIFFFYEYSFFFFIFFTKQPLPPSSAPSQRFNFPHFSIVGDTTRESCFVSSRFSEIVDLRLVIQGELC